MDDDAPLKALVGLAVTLLVVGVIVASTPHTEPGFCLGCARQLVFKVVSAVVFVAVIPALVIQLRKTHKEPPLEKK